MGTEPTPLERNEIRHLNVDVVVCICNLATQIPD